MATGGGRVQRALEEPERLRRATEARAAVGDVVGRRREELCQRRATWRADAQRELVTLGKVVLRDDGRDAVRPARVLRVGANGERLSRALADEQPERATVPAGDVHDEGARSRR